MKAEKTVQEQRSRTLQNKRNRGPNIHVAPGQEQHLPHEAWHVTQQMAGRVEPTTEVGGMPVNDNVGLEHEADIMGARANQF